MRLLFKSFSRTLSRGFSSKWRRSRSTVRRTTLSERWTCGPTSRGSRISWQRSSRGRQSRVCSATILRLARMMRTYSFTRGFHSRNSSFCWGSNTIVGWNNLVKWQRLIKAKSTSMKAVLIRLSTIRRLILLNLSLRNWWRRSRNWWGGRHRCRYRKAVLWKSTRNGMMKHRWCWKWGMKSSVKNNIELRSLLALQQTTSLNYTKWAKAPQCHPSNKSRPTSNQWWSRPTSTSTNSTNSTLSRSNHCTQSEWLTTRRLFRNNLSKCNSRT